MRCKTKPIPGNATVLLASIHLHGRGGGEGNSALFTDGAKKKTGLYCSVPFTELSRRKKKETKVS